MFVGIAVVLAAAALACVAWPLLRRPPAEPSSPSDAAGERRRINEQLFREATRDLTDALDADDAAQKQALIDELGARLLDEDSPESDTPAPAQDRAPGAVAGVVAVLVPVLALAAYLTVGEPGAETLKGFDRALTESLSDAELSELVADLRERLLDAPEEAKTWYLLGHTLMRQQRYGEAARAFESAGAQGGSDPSIDLYLLQARYLASGGALDGDMHALLQRVAGSQPDHPLVLEIQALSHFQSGDMARAIGFLERAIASAGAGERAVGLMHALDLARQRLGSNGQYIDVAVDVSERPPAGSTLFVVARPVGGGMPYAVVRRSASLLPMKVRLDDAVSMSAGNPLSNAGVVEVVARISLAGQAMAQASDWRWQSPPLSAADGANLQAMLAPPAESTAPSG